MSQSLTPLSAYSDSPISFAQEELTSQTAALKELVKRGEFSASIIQPNLATPEAILIKLPLVSNELKDAIPLLGFSNPDIHATSHASLNVVIQKIKNLAQKLHHDETSVSSPKIALFQTLYHKILKKAALRVSTEVALKTCDLDFTSWSPQFQREHADITSLLSGLLRGSVSFEERVQTRQLPYADADLFRNFRNKLFQELCKSGLTNEALLQDNKEIKRAFTKGLTSFWEHIEQNAETKTIAELFENTLCDFLKMRSLKALAQEKYLDAAHAVCSSTAFTDAFQVYFKLHSLSIELPTPTPSIQSPKSILTKHLFALTSSPAPLQQPKHARRPSDDVDKLRQELYVKLWTPVLPELCDLVKEIYDQTTKAEKTSPSPFKDKESAEKYLESLFWRATNDFWTAIQDNKSKPSGSILTKCLMEQLDYPITLGKPAVLDFTYENSTSSSRSNALSEGAAACLEALKTIVISESFELRLNRYYDEYLKARFLSPLRVHKSFNFPILPPHSE